MAIKQPTSPSSGPVRIVWNNGTANKLNTVLHQKQKIIDSEVLRLCDPLVPFRTGTLARSGILGTVIGSGEVKYIVSYAREQYYFTSTTRSYDANRGSKWFERMKTAHKKEIQKLIND